jgi:hypothetical protein
MKPRRMWKYLLLGRSDLSEEIEYHIAKGVFFKDHQLPLDRFFCYSEYMRQSMTHHITESLEVKPRTWYAIPCYPTIACHILAHLNALTS